MSQQRKKKSARSEVAVNGDAAKAACRMIVIIAATNHAKIALEELLDLLDGDLPRGMARTLGVVVKALGCVHEEGRSQTARVAVVTDFLRAYDMPKSSPVAPSGLPSTLLFFY